MKITVFNGSPRGRISNSHIIINSLLEGAKEAGAATEEIFLIEKHIGYCVGCFDCWSKTPGECGINDDMKNMINKYLESDFVGLATPVYGMLMTALLKNFTDRMLPLATPHIHKNEDGSFYHEGRVRSFPRVFYIANSGFPGEHNFDLLKAYLEMQKPVFEVYRNCGEILQYPADDSSTLSNNIMQFKNSLKTAGIELVSNGQVSQDTVINIHKQIISDEEYMAGANKEWDEELKNNDKR